MSNNNSLTLKARLAQKLKEKKLGRVSREVREIRLEKLEEKLEKLSTDDQAKAERLKSAITALENVKEKDNNFSGDFPQYSDKE